MGLRARVEVVGLVIAAGLRRGFRAIGFQPPACLYPKWIRGLQPGVTSADLSAAATIHFHPSRESALAFSLRRRARLEHSSGDSGPGRGTVHVLRQRKPQGRTYRQGLSGAYLISEQAHIGHAGNTASSDAPAAASRGHGVAFHRTLRTIQRLCLAVIGACIASSFVPMSITALALTFLLSLVASVVGTTVAVIDIWTFFKGRN